jgi:metal-responsive CopG/Arc/MetJ family transcriptional regulator
METIQIVLGTGLLRATDKAAKRARINRSALVRQALREHLKRQKLQELEAQDRAGYEKYPGSPSEAAAWEQEIAWPEL